MWLYPVLRGKLRGALGISSSSNLLYVTDGVEGVTREQIARSSGDYSGACMF